MIHPIRETPPRLQTMDAREVGRTRRGLSKLFYREDRLRPDKEGQIMEKKAIC
jgi:hypothetical protein